MESCLLQVKLASRSSKAGWEKEMGSIWVRTSVCPSGICMLLAHLDMSFRISSWMTQVACMETAPWIICLGI